MRLAILADIHGNLEALEAVLIDIDRQGADGLLVLGDIVGYGPDPVACIYRLREADAVCVLGNHDQALVAPEYLHELNPMARDTILRSREMVGEEELAFLRTFAFRHNEHDAVFAHANPLAPEDWQSLYLFEHVSWCLEGMEGRIAFVGHTHHAGIWCGMGDNCVPLTSSEVAIGRHRYLINVGSVGQPRDGDSRASFALWDVEDEHVELCRADYPVVHTQRKIRDLGWPAYVADRLARGE
jgi:predicted phosphodiesterase